MVLTTCLCIGNRSRKLNTPRLQQLKRFKKAHTDTHTLSVGKTVGASFPVQAEKQVILRLSISFRRSAHATKCPLILSREERTRGFQNFTNPCIDRLQQSVHAELVVLLRLWTKLYELSYDCCRVMLVTITVCWNSFPESLVKRQFEFQYGQWVRWNRARGDTVGCTNICQPFFFVV